MTITLEIPPDQESRIAAQARSTGLNVEQWLLSLAKLYSLPEAEHPFQNAASLVLRHMKTIPIHSLDSLPVDGASEHDHHLYGTPKKYVVSLIASLIASPWETIPDLANRIRINL